MGSRYHRLDALRIDRVEDNGIHALINQIVYLLHLQGNIALGIDELALQLLRSQFSCHLAAQDGDEVEIEVGQRHADLVGLGLGGHDKQRAG